MGARGPAPGRNPNTKDPSQRRHRIKPIPPEELAADGKVYGHDLPDNHEWPAETLAWWQTWRTCAQAQKFVATDWSFLLDTAVLHAEFWGGNLGLAAELRQRVAKFGATWEDRARLKVEIGDPEAKLVPSRLASKSDVARRSRLMRAVGD